MTHAVIQPQRAGLLLIAAAFACAGCSGLLGLDDKNFSGSGGTGTTTTTTPTSSSTGGAGGVGTGGVSTGGVTGGTGGVGAGGGIAGSGGGIGGTGGVPCDSGPIDDPDRLTEEFDFKICPPDDTGDTLKKRGFHIAWHDEGYTVPSIGLFGGQGYLWVDTDQSTFWYNGQKGPFIEKPLTGPFMVIADVKLTKKTDDALPEMVPQSGIGLMARDPASAGNTTQRWISIDRGRDYVNMTYTEGVHGSWSNGNGDPNQGSYLATGPAAGRIALCRDEQLHFHLWSYSDMDLMWHEHQWNLGGLEGAGMPSTVQVGIFLYAYKSPANTNIPGGVRGTTYYVHQHDLMSGSCDPTTYEP